VGTLAAVFFAFARDWWQLIRAGLRGIGSGRPFDDPESRLLWLLALGTIPGVIAGLLLEKWADTVFRTPGLVATNMAVMGAVLLLADREANGGGDLQRLSVRDIALIGLAQACAILPGVSRSGATISMGLFLGYRREEAARISFLLAMPITLGAALYKVPKLFSEGNDIVAIVAGIVAAAVFGFLSIRLLLAYVKTKNYLPFAYYRFAFAAVVWATLLFRAGR
jgi:undecaprenyl-diphosphatase